MPWTQWYFEKHFHTIWQFTNTKWKSLKPLRKSWILIILWGIHQILDITKLKRKRKEKKPIVGKFINIVNFINMWIFYVRFVVFIHVINYMKIYILKKIHVISYGSIVSSISSICCPCGQFHFQFSISSMSSKFIHVVHPYGQSPLCGQFDVRATIT